jgi:hypothetical protein
VKNKKLVEIQLKEEMNSKRITDRQNRVITLTGKPKMGRSDKQVIKKVEKKKEPLPEERDLMLYMAGFENLPTLISTLVDKKEK